MKGFLTGAGAALAMVATPAAAAVDIYIFEDGDDLVTLATGTFAVSRLGAFVAPVPDEGVLSLSGNSAVIFAGSGPADGYLARVRLDRALDFSGPLTTSLVSGAIFGFDFRPTGGRIAVAEGYRDGDAILATARYRNTTLDGASFDRGTWTIDFLNAAAGGGLADRVTLRVGKAPPVPEPATWAMMVAGFMLAGSAMRRRRRAVIA